MSFFFLYENIVFLYEDAKKLIYLSCLFVYSYQYRMIVDSTIARNCCISSSSTCELAGLSWVTVQSYHLSDGERNWTNARENQ